MEGPGRIIMEVETSSLYSGPQNGFRYILSGDLLFYLFEWNMVFQGAIFHFHW